MPQAHFNGKKRQKSAKIVPANFPPYSSLQNESPLLILKTTVLSRYQPCNHRFPLCEMKSGCHHYGLSSSCHLTRDVWSISYLQAQPPHSARKSLLFSTPRFIHAVLLCETMPRLLLSRSVFCRSLTRDVWSISYLQAQPPHSA